MLLVSVLISSKVKMYTKRKYEWNYYSRDVEIVIFSTSCDTVFSRELLLLAKDKCRDVTKGRLQCTDCANKIFHITLGCIKYT